MTTLINLNTEKNGISPIWGIAILTILYAVGLVGMLIPLHPDFVFLTPANLLLSLFVMLFYHPRWNLRSGIFFASCFLVGFGAEIIGVHTGLLFGGYHYGNVLGWKMWDTPLLIGFNWLLLVYATGVSVQYAFPNIHWLPSAILSALVMVVLDLFIEPVAIEYGFWYWEEQVVPLQNYLGWFVVALPLQIYFHLLFDKISNKVAPALLILQFLFFIILGLYL
ncbi:MAG: carotenoid biosynthesis protein [Saprospiraceae bacterium]|nr:carotenoid biosynthesis protein [Saprospiraceae bacterium]